MGFGFGVAGLLKTSIWPWILEFEIMVLLGLVKDEADDEREDDGEGNDDEEELLLPTFFS